MKNMNIKKLLLIFIIVFTLVGGITFSLNQKVNINKVLEEKEYSYLPVEAQNYIKDVYEKTGEVLLTEQNKEENTPYLNPKYVEYLALSSAEKEEVEVIPNIMIIDYGNRKVAQSGNYPSSYNLRSVNGKNYVTPVRDQGDLGICWAFATAGATESHLLKTNDQTYTSSSQLISERQLDYAASKNGIKDYSNEYLTLKIIRQTDGTLDYRGLGDGGNFYLATIPLASGVSLIDYNNFKSYSDSDLSKMELSEILNHNKSLYEVNTTINFPEMKLRDYSSQPDVRESYLNEIKENVMNNGAAYASTYMHSSCRYYDSNLNNTLVDAENCSELDYHAMQIIGWDDDLEYSYCADNNVHKASTTNCSNIVQGKGVWILKNSWGSTTPYPYLAYDSPETTIGFVDDISSNQNKTWDNNYINGDGAYIYTQKTYYLSNTNIKDTEKLEKIKFITENKDNTYQVTIYASNGTFTYSNTSDLPGLMTIDIDDYIEVDEDSRIVVRGAPGYFLDKVMFFTSNIDDEPYIDMDTHQNKIINTSTRLYSITKNIPSSRTITYKVYNTFDRDVTNQFTITNNVVAENNINTLIKPSSSVYAADYRIDAIYNSEVISSTDIEKTTGTEEPDHYTVMFDPNGGSGVMEDVGVYVGENYTLPSNRFIRNNYNFIGWNTKANGTGINYTTQISRNNSDDITLYAQWRGAEKTVTFNANGGTVSPTSKIVNYGSQYGELPIPERENYAFTGWTYNNIPIDSNSIVDDKLNLKANWESNSYNIIYDGNGGTINNANSLNIVSNYVATDTANIGINKGLSTNIFERHGYAFKEWNTKADGTGTSYSESQTINLNNIDSIRLYAIWIDISYTIKFDMNGSNLSRPASMTVLENETITLPTVFNNSDYAFLGWYKEKSCIHRFTDTTISTDITLYAKYTRKLNNLKVTGIGNKYYSGKNITQSIKVIDGILLLTPNTDYKVTYSNNKNIGTATVTITGINNYSSSIRKTFKIIPKAPTMKKVTSTAKKSATIQYSSVAGGVYYQVSYKVKGGSTWKSFNTKGTKVTKKLFASKRYYYYKVRAYKKVGTKTYYGPYSSIKYVKIK